MHPSSIDQPRATTDEDASTLLDTLGGPDDGLTRAEDRTTLSAWLPTLDERERTVVALYYSEDLTQAEIGRRLGYSQMHVSRLLRQATEGLRETADAQERQASARLAVA